MRSLALVVLLFLPLAAAALPAGVDASLRVTASGEPTEEDPQGLLRFTNATPGEWVQWRLELDAPHAAIEVRVDGAFDVERREQVVPLLLLDAGERTCIDVRARGACDDATFVQSPNERVWEAEDRARVHHASGDARSFVYRLNVPGPANATLALSRDLRPPEVTAGAPTNVTHFSFLLSSSTDELAIVELQVRRVGATEWVTHPTPDLNLLQRFPVQGLHPDTEHEYRLVARDWAGNEATTATQRMRTLPAPVAPAPVVTPLDPAPNATLPNGSLVLRARVDVGEVPLAADGLILLLDLRPVAADLRYEGGVLSHEPSTPLAPGRHTVSVEATNEVGARGFARWTFEVEGAGSPERSTPGLPLAFALVAAALVARAAARAP